MARFSGPTEAVLSIVLVLVVSGLGFVPLWHTTVLGEWTVAHLLLGGMSVSVALNVVEHTRAVVRWCSARRVPLSQPLLELLPLLLVTASNAVWLFASRAVTESGGDVLSRAAVPFTLQAGMFLAYFETRVLAQRICRERAPHMYLIVVPSCVVALAAVYGYLVGGMPFDDVMLAKSMLLVHTAFFSYLVKNIVYQLSTALKINVFTIPY